jgi:L-aspartate oxidase
MARRAREKKTDVLVIGCGIAGSTAALRLSQEESVRVTVITGAADPLETATYYAQGGIIYRSLDDSAELLAEDIYRAGDGLNNVKAVSILCQEGPPLLQRLLIEELGVPFDAGPAGDWHLALEGAQSTARILHVADATGRAIEERLVSALLNRPNVELLTRRTAVDLLTPAHHAQDRRAVYEPLSCCGAYVFDQERGEVDTLVAKATVVATGGLGQIYLHTTNPPAAGGDGLAMAHRAGARVINAEYVQFHPTAFYDRYAPRFLISEAVRGEGARLVTEAGETFMEKYDSEWGDLAPRDLVSRSIHREMLTTGAKCVYLDLVSYMAAESIRERFPNIYEQCLTYGVDITRDRIPVVPAAHYCCGGIWVDEYGRSSVTNLYAVGEVSCTGVHGANRLASSGLLEGLVWGWRAAEDIVAKMRDGLVTPSIDIPPWYDEDLTETADPALVVQDMTTIRHIMWNYVGLIRSRKRLERAIDDLSSLEREIEKFYRATRLTDGLIGLRHAVQTALIVARAAWENKESRGCHFREDEARPAESS